MSATDELRKMLDERGVKWMKPSKGNEHWTRWHGMDGVLFTASEDARGCVWIGASLTPEQAIAATLGSGTCRSTTDDNAWCFVCSECGKSFPRSQLHLAHNHGEINYCPNCGCKVVGE